MVKEEKQYTAEDGLNILRYLGISNLTEEERQVFRGKWEEFYRGHNEDAIQSTWVLYSKALPFICGDGGRGSFMVSQIRDSDFGERLKNAELYEKLKQGTNLSEILGKEPHRFIKVVEISDLLKGKVNPFTT